MGKFVMVVQSRATPGCEADYDAWYDSEHYRDVLSVPGVISGRRFDARPGGLGAEGLPYLAIFEIEADDPRNVMTEMNRRVAEGSMSLSDSLEMEATVLWFYELHEMPA